MVVFHLLFKSETKKYPVYLTGLSKLVLVADASILTKMKYNN